MRKDIDELLCKRYPFIFQDRNAPMNRTHISCGDGWFWLIDQLCSSIQWHIDSTNSCIERFGNNEKSYWHDQKAIEQVVAIQVKEKMSGLRFYVNGGDDKTSAMISFSESLSYHICEVCGSTKDIGCTDGWLTTLCKECNEKSEKKSEGFEMRGNVFDYFADIRSLKEGALCFDTDDNACLLVRHVSEYQKEVQMIKTKEKKVVERQYLFVESESTNAR